MTSSARHSTEVRASDALPCQSRHLIRSSAAALVSTSAASVQAPLDHLPQHGHPHRQMKPVQNMFRLRGDVLLQTAQRLGPIGHENHLLERVHPLLAQRVDKPGTWLIVHRLDESETASRGIRNPAIAMKRGQALARDRLEPVVLTAADIATIHADI
jgi:hypothetical protein